MFVLSKYAFGPITAAVAEAREGARRTRSTAPSAIATPRPSCSPSIRRKIDAARGDAQKLIAEGRAVAEKMRADLLEHTRKEQQDMLERARREIESEKDKAIAQLRREAVDLALAGASKVIEQNLESQKNRQLVESYLSSIGTSRCRLGRTDARADDRPELRRDVARARPAGGRPARLGRPDRSGRERGGVGSPAARVSRVAARERASRRTRSSRRRSAARCRATSCAFSRRW